MLTNYFFLFGVLTIGLLSCNNSEETTFEKEGNTVSENSMDQKKFSLDWIEGNWSDTTLRGGTVTFCENWKKDKENLFTGKKFQIAKGDTSSGTELTLVKTDGKYYYSFFGKDDQVTFVQDSLSNNYISFINTKDQFPTSLSYEWNGESMKISFSGMAKGVFRAVSFNTTKTK